MELRIINGDLLSQDVDCIINAWNRNPFPWWLLIPQGVSKAIRLHAGTAPFRELRAHGLLPLGGAVLTGPGSLKTKGIIHVAGIGLNWRASERSIRDSTANAIAVAKAANFKSVAFPLIGAGTGGIGPEKSLAIMKDVLDRTDFAGTVLIVKYDPR